MSDSGRAKTGTGEQTAGLISGGCHCLCSANHPTVRGCCTGEATTRVQLNSPITGPVDVQMCRSCAVATEDRCDD